MRRIALGLALTMALFGLVAVGAISVSAAGHEFIASKTGKTTSKGTNVQVFKTGAGTIECSTVSGSGEITETKSVTHKESLVYSNCEAFGFTKVAITAVNFEFNANGAARLEKAVTVTPEGSGCNVVIPAQTVEAVTYTNETGGKLGAEAVITKIHSKGSGAPCGGENTEGTYSGKMVATLEGGTVEWK